MSLVPRALPPPGQTAFLLDLDGTLLDIAPTPDSVVVAPGLVETLRHLRNRLGGAVAVVTGRPVEQVDALLGDAVYAVAGEHGGAFRFAPGAKLERPSLATPPSDWFDEAELIAADYPGALLERKARGFVFHFRAVPSAGPELRSAAQSLIASRNNEFQLMPAHMAWEVRPYGADKGRAVRALMQRAPFTGRRPIFLGDDVTDLDGMDAARSFNGVGLYVPDTFGSPARVRAWLAACASPAAARAWPVPEPPGE